ncbi:MAG: hypothetical protein A2Z04_08985 [Chloroflexi bacterium RBG_16_57_9]|nr:MAG: hypothetical protein A2Z04_08985 [Chloroflexi bacterium RBG_16_57_9]
MRPLIGIPCHNDKSRDEKIPPRFAMSQSYCWALERAGAAPMLIPLLHNEEVLRTLYEQMDGLLLAGGGDVDPARYGERPHSKLWEVDILRDRVEIITARWALADKKPILAVCRGIQALNVAAGGSLYQDLPSQHPSHNDHNWHLKQPRNYRAHQVSVVPDSKLAKVLGTQSVMVNSLHHQAVKEVAPGFRINAIAPDGVIEGMEHVNGCFALAVQWHPEVLAIEDAGMQRLFDALVEESRNRKVTR